jgi:drug/metabolite transporter (DMT)-like permease
MLALLALGSSVVWGTSDFIAGLKAKTLPAAAVVGWSQGIALVALSLLVALTGGWDFTGWPEWALLAGLSGTTALVCFYAALATGTMGVVAPIASLGVVVPVVLGLASGDQPSVLAYAGMAVAVVGILMASGPELSGAVSARPLVLAAVAALGFGITLFALDRGARYSLVETLWGMRTASVAVFVVAAVVLRRTGGVSTRDLPVLAVVGLADLTANALFATASSRGLVSVASVLGSLYPVMTVLLARVVLHERLRPVQVAGVGLSAVGVALIAA